MTYVVLLAILAVMAGAIALAAFGLRDGRAVWPLLVGFLVLGIGLSLGGPTGYAINPARDFGLR